MRDDDIRASRRLPVTRLQGTAYSRPFNNSPALRGLRWAMHSPPIIWSRGKHFLKKSGGAQQP
jgi:hypothetical protein